MGLCQETLGPILQTIHELKFKILKKETKQICVVLM